MDFAAELASRLVEADERCHPVGIDVLEANRLVPVNLSQAMQVQAATVKLLGQDILGWKIAIAADGTPIAAPMLDIESVNSIGIATVSKQAPKAIEVEICYVLREDILPVQSSESFNRASLLQKIASVHLGAELLAPRIKADSAVPFPLALADRLGNHSFVLGPAVRGQADSVTATDVLACSDLRVERDGVIVFENCPVHPIVDPLEPLLRFINSPPNDQLVLRAGQVVTTGSLCGALEMSPECKIDVFLDGRHDLQVIVPPARGLKA